MKEEKEILYKCYQLLHDVLADAFHTETILFEAPYKDVSRIDQGFRATVWNDYNDGGGKIKLSGHPSKYRLFVIGLLYAGRLEASAVWVQNLSDLK